MRLHAIALLVHILGVIATFSGLSMQQRAGSRLRKATTYAEAVDRRHRRRRRCRRWSSPG
jgi:hypothetical protein